MKIYVAFDDTDSLDCGRGTGKLARWFEEKLPAECKMPGVVRHQLLVQDDIPYTSHNSSLCCIVDAPDESYVDKLIPLAVEHIKEHFVEGSDPGLCVAVENNPNLSILAEFARVCLARKVFQDEAFAAAKGIHLSGHGGTNDGIIGAAAAVGLTHLGESGRFIEFGDKKRLRDYDKVTTIGEVRKNNILVFSVDRHSPLPVDKDPLDTQDWLRPRLMAGNAVIPVVKREDDVWEIVGYRKKENDE